MAYTAQLRPSGAATQESCGALPKGTAAVLPVTSRQSGVWYTPRTGTQGAQVKAKQQATEMY